jgi:hypothetical protein
VFGINAEPVRNHFLGRTSNVTATHILPPVK